jgi:DNA-binding response OmpR family regulator
VTRRVLVVDDDPIVRRALANALARSGFEVTTADDGAIALQLADVTPVELAVIDFHMPTPGLHVVRELRARHGDAMFIVVLTGDIDAEESCVEAGADAVLAKPIAPSELRRRLVAARARAA